MLIVVLLLVLMAFVCGIVVALYQPALDRGGAAGRDLADPGGRARALMGTRPGEMTPPVQEAELAKRLAEMDPVSPGQYADFREVCAEIRNLKEIVKALGVRATAPAPPLDWRCPTCNDVSGGAA